MRRLALILAVASIAAPAPGATPAIPPMLGNPFGGAPLPASGALCVNSSGASCAPGDPASSATLAFSATGTAQTVGPWTPQYGRDVYIAFAIGGGSASISVVATTDGLCADGYQLSSAGGTLIRGAFVSLSTGRYREDLGAEYQPGTQLCVTATPASGASVAGSLGQ